MATEQAQADDMILDCYQRYVADLDPVTPNDVYAGFGGTMGGLMLGVTGWMVYLWTEMGSVAWRTFWIAREIALGSAGVGVVLLVGGAIVGLMGLRDVGRSAVLGAILCLAGLVVFGATYPQQWNVVSGMDYSPIGVTLYGFGLGMLIFRLGGAVGCRVSE